MKKLSLLFLVTCLVFTSCKEKSEESDVSETEKETESTSGFDYTLSLAQWSFHLPIHKGTMDPMDFAKRAKELGFSAIQYVDQLYEIDTTVSYQEAVMKLAAEWKKKNEEHGVEADLIMIDRAGELADPDPEKRKAAVEMHKNWVDAAEFLGTPALRINLFGLTEPEAWHKASVESLKDLCAYAATKNIKILTENHAQLSNDASKVAAVMAEVNMESCGTLPDFGNWCVMREGGARWGPAPCIEEYDPFKGMAELLPYAGGVSAKANDFDENGDETGIDYYRMMQIVKDSGFSGYIGIEFEDEVSMDPSEKILATKALVIKAIEQTK